MKASGSTLTGSFHQLLFHAAEGLLYLGLEPIHLLYPTLQQLSPAAHDCGRSFLNSATTGNGAGGSIQIHPADTDLKGFADFLADGEGFHLLFTNTTFLLLFNILHHS
jgi:hypothetical protein